MNQIEYGKIKNFNKGRYLPYGTRLTVREGKEDKYYILSIVDDLNDDFLIDTNDIQNTISAKYWFDANNYGYWFTEFHHQTTQENLNFDENYTADIIEDNMRFFTILELCEYKDNVRVFDKESNKLILIPHMITDNGHNIFFETEEIKFDGE